MRGLVSSSFQWLLNFISSFLACTVDAGAGSVGSFSASIGGEASAGSLCTAADDCISAGGLGFAEPPQTGSTPKTPEEKKVANKAKKARRQAKKAERRAAKEAADKKDDDDDDGSEDVAILKWKKLILNEGSNFGLSIINRVNDWEILLEFKKQRPLECMRPLDYSERAGSGYKLTKTELKLIGDLYISLFNCSARDEVYQEIGQKIWGRYLN